MNQLDFSKPEKLQTRVGRQVRIYATDGYGDYPVHGAALLNRGPRKKTMSKKTDATEDFGSSDCSPARECDLNPVHQGLYEWGDRLNTKVEINRDGSGTIIQGDQVIKLDCFGFFRDVTNVFEKAISAMPDSDLEMTLNYRSIGTTRSLPTCGWD